MKSRQVHALFLAGLALVGMLSGCAQVDRNVAFSYHPFVKATGGKGEMQVVVGDNFGVYAKNSAGAWVVGMLKNNDGENIGELVSDIAPGALVADAFSQEFRQAGYTVRRVAALSGEVGKGIDFTEVKLGLDQTSSVFKADTVASVAVSIELWKNGRKFRKFDYRSKYSDTAVLKREEALQNTLEQTVREIIRQAVPEVIKVMEE